MQSALEGLSTVGGGNVSVVQNANVYRVTFTNDLAGDNVPLFEAGGTAGAVVNDAYGLTVSKNLFLRELGINNAGALRSISGLNQHTGDNQSSAVRLTRLDRRRSRQPPRPPHRR